MVFGKYEEMNVDANKRTAFSFWLIILFFVFFVPLNYIVDCYFSISNNKDKVY